jgi:hypothetical protein
VKLRDLARCHSVVGAVAEAEMAAAGNGAGTVIEGGGAAGGDSGPPLQEEQNVETFCKQLHVRGFASRTYTRRHCVVLFTRTPTQKQRATAGVGLFSLIASHHVVTVITSRDQFVDLKTSSPRSR